MPKDKKSPPVDRDAQAKRRKSLGKKPAYDIMKDPKYAKAAKNLLENGGIPGPTGGRPNKYHPAIVQRAWDLINDSENGTNGIKKATVWTFAALCDALGISESTGEKWLDEFPPFLRVAHAHRSRLKQVYEKANLKTALGGKGNSSSIQFALTNLDPVKYKRRQHIEKKVDKKVEEVTDLDVENMSADEKRAHLEFMKKIRDEEDRAIEARQAGMPDSPE